MKGFYVKISLIPENSFYLVIFFFRQEPYEGIFLFKTKICLIPENSFYLV